MKIFVIGVDTFSWQKLILLRNSKWKPVFEELIDRIAFFITTAGEKEFRHRFKNDIEILERIFKLPILDVKLEEFKRKGFDLNDASLLEYSEVRGYRIITEDRPMITEGITERKNIIFLIDFIFELYKRDNYFNSQEFYQLVKLFRKWRNIKKKKAERLLEKRLK